MPNERWYIWLKYCWNDDNEAFGYGIYPVSYAHKSSAVHRAKLRFGENKTKFNTFTVEWKVSTTDPWRDEKHDRT